MMVKATSTISRKQAPNMHVSARRNSCVALGIEPIAMPLRIAVPSASCRTPLFRARALAGRVAPANENRPTELHDPVLVAALRHFSHHGLGAAQDARIRAARASVAHRPAEACGWLEIFELLGGVRH